MASGGVCACCCAGAGGGGCCWACAPAATTALTNTPERICLTNLFNILSPVFLFIAPPARANIRISLWNHDRAIFCGHLLAFGIAYHEPHEIRARLQVEAGFYADAGFPKPVQSSIEQAHLDNFFATGNEIAVIVKNRGRERNVVPISSFGL